MKLDYNAIKSGMSDFPEVEISVYDTIDSTNIQAKRMLESGNKASLLIVSDEQTQGRGRQGKSFFSPSGGLYLSVVIHPDGQSDNIVMITTIAAIAVSRAIEKLTDIKTEIKWVNDVYVNGKKVCGILSQAVTLNGNLSGIIIGIGVNTSDCDFPEELAQTADSLNVHIDRNLLASEIAKNIFILTDNLNDKSYMNEYREKSNVIGKNITYYKNNVPHSARAVGIDDNGGLVVEENNKKITLTSGEITVRVKE
jgi:BirA family biotin operon repressor/biotin-[acetyl-CoA-carboxylase] ligase